jgi:hypothetical protein
LLLRVARGYCSARGEVVRQVQLNLRADGISIGVHKYRVEQQWKDAFESLEAFPEVQEIQLQRVKKYWDIAARDSDRFKLETELGIALGFNIAGQNGGIDFKHGEEIHWEIERRY